MHDTTHATDTAGNDGSPAEAGARYRGTIAYDGGGFHGSQLQPDVRTVQGEIERALSRFFDRPCRIDLAGRTDAGVHALAQEIAFEAPAHRRLEDLARGLRALLPEDIGVSRLERASPGFHPRFDARRRRYEYVVATGALAGSPFLRDRAWRIRGDLAVERLAGMADALIGERSFEAFARSGQPERGTRCLVESAAWSRHGADIASFRIVADRFLHHMVRYLVGTMLEIARERRDPGDLAAMLAGAQPTRAAFPAPPQGLYLTGVEYEGGWNRPAGIPGLTT